MVNQPLNLTKALER